MSNDRKMFINDAAAGLPSTGEVRTEPTQTTVGSKIRNLPDDIILTQEMLINNVCRICATYFESGQWMIPLYQPTSNEKRTLAKIANKFLPIKVKETDGLPKVVCIKCADHLNMWCRMWDSCSDVHNALVSQAKLFDRVSNPLELEAIPTILHLEEPRYHNRVEQSHLIETVQSVLATYLLNTSLTDLVCQKCHSKSSSEQFYQHLSSKHEGVRDKEDVEVFVRDHVTFEEALDSDDGDCTTVVSSTEASEANARLDCPLCSAAYSTPTRLFQHLTKHDVNLDSIPCCGLSRNKSELLRHMKKEHKTDSLRCKSCFHVAANMSELTAHVACCDTDSKSDVSIQPVSDETNQKRIPAVCPDCNRTFSNIYNMLNHMKKHSDASVRFDCECGRSYTTRGNLVAHQRVAHLGELPYACEECGESFPSRTARDVHSRLHTGVRPFSCEVCSRSFHARNSLNKHRETHGPRQFECELCGKKFRRKAHLRYHVGTHPRRAT